MKLILAILAVGALSAKLASVADVESNTDIDGFDHLKRSIVRIQTVHPNFDWFRPFANSDGSVALGSGFFVQTEPYLLIATNQHVINDALSVKVQLLLHGETQWEVDIVSASPKFDLALLTLKDDKGFKKVLKQAGIVPTALHLSKKVASMGQDVIAMGFPLGQNSLKISKGNVAGNEVVSRNLCIQSTAPISPGNSGGPLLDEMGTEVVGVNFAGATSGENINFVIPAWRVQAMVNLHRISQPKIPTGNASWQRLGFTTPEHGLLTVQPSEALYKTAKGCHEGVYVGRVSPDGFASKAMPPVVEGSMLVSVAGKKLDKFGKAAIPHLMEGKASIDDLFFISPNLLEEVSFSTCHGGKIIAHKVKTVMTPEYEKGVPYIDEPVTRKFNEKYEMFGDVGVMSMTVNHISAAYQKTHAPQITRWLLPERVTKPRLMIVYVRPGTYASEVLPEGAAVDKVNGKVVRSIEDWQKAIATPNEDVWTLETDLGVVLAVPYKETLRSQLKQSALQPFVLTEGVKQAAIKVGFMEEVDDEEDDDEVTEKQAVQKPQVKKMDAKMEEDLEDKLNKKMEKLEKLEEKLEKTSKKIKDKEKAHKQLAKAEQVHKEQPQVAKKAATKKEDTEGDDQDYVNDDDDDLDGDDDEVDEPNASWHKQEYQRAYVSQEPSMANYGKVTKPEATLAKPKSHQEAKAKQPAAQSTAQKVAEEKVEKKSQAFRAERTSASNEAEKSSFVSSIFSWFAAPDVSHKTESHATPPSNAKPQAFGQHAKQATLLQAGEQPVHAAGPLQVISALTRHGLVTEGSAEAQADQLAAVMGTSHLPM